MVSPGNGNLSAESGRASGFPPVWAAGAGAVPQGKGWGATVQGAGLGVGAGDWAKDAEAAAMEKAIAVAAA